VWATGKSWPASLLISIGSSSALTSSELAVSASWIAAFAICSTVSRKFVDGIVFIPVSRLLKYRRTTSSSLNSILWTDLIPSLSSFVREHLEYLYVTLRRNSAHRVTDIVTIFGRILYVFTENSVRFCTVVCDGPAPPGTEFSTNILEFGTCVRLHQYLLCTVFLHKLLEISLHKRKEFSKVSTGLQ
jgi:hypothetical protein